MATANSGNACRWVFPWLILGLTAACGGEPSATPDPGSDTPAAATPNLPLARGPGARQLDDEVRRYVADLSDAGLLSGNLLIGSRDSILVLQSYGMADGEAGIPNDPHTRFVIASLTKTFTAGAILTLEDEGLLSRDDPLARFLPDFPRADEITIRHLLLHESGVGYLESGALLESPETPIGLEALVERIAERPFVFDPGDGEAYSNAGYSLLARVIEEASGQPHEGYLETRLFEPLGMSESGQWLAPVRRPNGAVGHIPGPPPDYSRVPQATNLGYAIGSGALSSTVVDLWRWARAVADEELYAWKSAEWPYGWGREEIGEHRGIEQTGGMTGFMSNLLVFPAADRFVVVLLNQEYGGWIDLGRGLAALALGETPTPIEIPRRADLAATEAARFVGTFGEGDQQFRVAIENGDLWLYWTDWPIGKYLRPVGEAEFSVPSDRGRIRFEDPGADGTYGSLVWDFGEDAMVLQRAP